MQPVLTAVIGAGYLGRFHAQKSRVFQDDADPSIDPQHKVLTIVRKPPPGADTVPEQVVYEERSCERGDALKLEITAFLRSVREGGPALVSGEDGLRALETAIRITELVQAGGDSR